MPRRRLRGPHGGAPGAATTGGGNILVRGGGPDPDSLDPQKARGFEAQSIVRDLCEGLTTLDQGRQASPRAAPRLDVSADGRTYTFHLRDDAHWSNGDPLVAADFVAGLQRLVDPATASAYAQYADVIANSGEIIAGTRPAPPSGSQRRIRRPWSSPYAPRPLTCRRCCRTRAPARCTGPRLPRTRGGFARPGVMVSNGAFVLKRVGAGPAVLLTRNHHYWNDAATQLDAVKYLLIPDENAELARYRGGELQVTFVVPRGQFDWVKAQPRATSCTCTRS